ncbi:MAG: 3'(2'),5'-bisphosphate nucleotidase CysQ [Pikeienuella sp.]
MPEPAVSAASYAEDRALLVTAVEAAGAIALARHRGPVRRWEKSGGQGPVSDADLEVNAHLSEHLRTARPGYGWLSEEDPDDHARLAATRVFIIDPIDGTRAFLADDPGFSVVAAVVEAGRAVAGAVHLPARGETYAAHLAGGATKTVGGATAPVAADPGLGLAGGELLASRAAMAPENWPRGVPAMRRVQRPSLAWRLCLVADGRAAATLTIRPAWEWDIAAGALIAAEAGCIVTDHEGAALVFNQVPPRLPGLIVAAPELHAGLLALRCPPVD